LAEGKPTNIGRIEDGRRARRPNSQHPFGNINKMKTRYATLFALGAAAILLQGCVAVPPLIQVQHKENNSEVLRRLDSIDRRLDRLEQDAPKQ
jgi:hypothetical protein